MALCLYTGAAPLQGEAATWTLGDKGLRTRKAGVLPSLLDEIGEAAGAYVIHGRLSIDFLKQKGIPLKIIDLIDRFHSEGQRSADHKNPTVLIAVEEDYDFFPHAADKLSHDQ
ncbi:MAG: hypothetical protein KDI13_04640 [Alphaproteobacteria bacterium]|nr:hypothetical protein [Alphaproteobacteria bacterium]